MRIRELSLRNYRVFEEVDLELPSRVIGVFGPNGSGKSALVEAFTYALYGRARTQKDQIRTEGLLTDCAVRLVFEHGGQQFEVRRTITGKGHRTDAELYAGGSQLATGVSEVDAEIQRLLRMDQHVFRASVFAEQKQLDAFSDITKAKRKEMVLRLLGIRPVDEARTAARKEARNVGGDAQRLAGTLPDLAEQEATLERASQEADQAKTRAAEAAESLAEAEGRAKAAEIAFEASDRVRERVELLAERRAGQDERRVELEASHKELTKRIASLRKDLGGLSTLEKEGARLAGARERFAAGRRLVETSEEARGLEAELASIPEVDAAEALTELQAADEERRESDRAATRAESARERASDELAAAENALTRVTEADPSQPCPTCGRRLGDDFAEYMAHCKKAVAGAKKKVTEASRVLRDAQAALKAAANRHGAATKRGEQAQRAAEMQTSLAVQLKKARKKTDELAAPFGGSVPDLAQLEAEARREGEVEKLLAQLVTERKRLGETESDLERTGNSLNECRTRIEELDRKAAKLSFDAEDHARLKKERDEAARLLDAARATERDAADAHKAALGAVKELQAEIRKVKEMRRKVEELRDDARYVDRVSTLLEGFRTYLYGRIVPELSRQTEALFRELTASEYEDLRIDEETLAIEIADGARYFPIERFSGSETDLANLALRVAISKHLSYMSGTDIGLLVLDEVLGSLDVERKDLFVGAMGRLSNHFHQLFVITHAEQVKDQFQAVIEVRKVGRRRSQAVLV